MKHQGNGLNNQMKHPARGEARSAGRPIGLRQDSTIDGNGRMRARWSSRKSLAACSPAWRQLSPGSGKAIACLLVEKASSGKIKKVKKALRSIGKKSGAIGKASVAD